MPSPAAPWQILVVDDHEAVLQGTVVALQKTYSETDIRTAATAQATLELLQLQLPSLVETLSAQPRVIGSERILTHPPVAPPPFFPPEQVGFVDFPLDGDGFVRRSLLATYGPTGRYHFSLALHLASRYLEGEGLPLSNSETNPLALRFGDRDILPIGPHTGGYVRGDIAWIIHEG